MWTRNSVPSPCQPPPTCTDAALGTRNQPHIEPDLEQGSTPPLAELSDLLGIEVVGVRRLRVQVGGRPQPDPNAWKLLAVGPAQEARWLSHVLTRRLRDGWWLT